VAAEALDVAGVLAGGTHVADDLPARRRRARLNGERDAHADDERREERGEEERELHWSAKTAVTRIR
jgi:hypothetical protein